MSLGLSLAALAALQILLSLAAQLVVLRGVGAGAMTDAWVAAQTMPMLVVSLFAVPLQQVWLPRLSLVAPVRPQWLQASRLAQGQSFALIGLASLLLALSSRWWTGLLFPGLAAQGIEGAVRMTGWLLLGAVFNAQALLLTASLRARGTLVLPEFINAASTLALVLAIAWWVPRHGVEAAAWASAARSVLAYGLMWHVAGRPLPALGRGLRHEAPWSDLKPLLAGASIYKTNPLVDRFWASQAADGGMTVFNLAQTGLGAVAQVMERALCMPRVPALARLQEAGRHAEVWQSVRGVVLRVGAIVAGLVLVLLLAKPFWADFLWIALRLDPTAAGTMWWIAMALSGFVWVGAAGSLPVAAFIALGDSRTPVVCSVIAFVIGAVGKSVAFVLGGLPALAAATSLYYLGNLLSVGYLLKKKLLHVGSA